MLPENSNLNEAPVETTRASVLIADDDPGIRLILRHRLEADGYRVEEAADSQSALEALTGNRHEVALLDIMMPGAGGLEVLTAARAQASRALIIVITAASTMNNAVEAMKRGAHDYLTKPFENLDLVATAVGRAIDIAAQNADFTRLKDEVNRQLVGGEIIGRSPAMQEVYKLIGRVVNNDATVLLRGESGTGKELVARAIHFKSQRWRGPFVALNCSAIPHGLLESELFGHERGSFTGANERRAGKIEQASGGTLFLDEIGDLPVELQPKLLRVLQEREFSRVGGFETLRMQARVIAATNQDLEAAVLEKKFREDLYFASRVIPIDLAAPARAPRGHRRADRLLYRQGGARDGRELALHQRRSPRQTAKLLVAGQRPRTRKRGPAGSPPCLLPASTVRADDVELGRGGARPAGASLDHGASLTELIARRISEMIESNGEEPRDLYQKLVGELEKPLIEIGAGTAPAANLRVHTPRASSGSIATRCARSSPNIASCRKRPCRSNAVRARAHPTKYAAALTLLCDGRYRRRSRTGGAFADPVGRRRAHHAIAPEADFEPGLPRGRAPDRRAMPSARRDTHRQRPRRYREARGRRRSPRRAGRSAAGRRPRDHGARGDRRGLHPQRRSGPHRRGGRRRLYRLRRDLFGRLEERYAMQCAWTRRPACGARRNRRCQSWAIGGITEATMPQVLAAGADAAAIITDVVECTRYRHQESSALLAIHST